MISSISIADSCLQYGWNANQPFSGEPVCGYENAAWRSRCQHIYMPQALRSMEYLLIANVGLLVSTALLSSIAE